MNDAEIPVIAVDGPSGVGKGTLCRWLAHRLSWHLLDSGALYRVTALAAQKHRVTDDSQIARLAENLQVDFHTQGNAEIAVFFEGDNVSQLIRSEDCGNTASRVASLPRVRAALLQRQRDFRQPPGLVADGRDMGSVVFADAPVKIFLTASPQERAIRRYKQLREKGIDASLSKLTEDIAQRDARDATRKVAPLKSAVDAQLVDTTGMTIDAVQKSSLAIISDRLGIII
jgi:cytidylate kinase